ncbi:hypothetical protein B0H13DRAFT_2310907 [Mycena leptocephala]|nr:hypothetical protein B0H13DRAFT_2310907 [Mycena leptocephala]
MNTPTSSATVFETAELCAYIIDFLHDCTDLKSCALVSHAFIYPAQLHLFYEIDLDIPSPAAVARLSKILDAAPHLCLHIRRLCSSMDAVILAHISNLHLPRLNFLQLFSHLGANVGLPAFHAAQNLLALPSLRTFVMDVSPLDRAAIDVLFARCTPTLRTLDLRYVKIVPRPNVIRSSPPADVRRRAQLKELRLLCTLDGAWFTDPQCPLDLSQLQLVDVYISSSPELRRVLEAASSTIEELRRRPSLAPFFALTKLRLFGEPSDLIAALEPLRKLDRLQVLIIASRTFQPYAHPEDYQGPPPEIARRCLAQLDATVAAIHLPILTRFELSVLPPMRDVVLAISPNSASDSQPTGLVAVAVLAEKTRVAMVQAFPQMHARGVLVVREYRDVA